MLSCSRAAGRHWGRLPVHLPRHGRGRADRPPGRGDVLRADRRDRRREQVFTAPAMRIPSACWLRRRSPIPTPRAPRFPTPSPSPTCRCGRWRRGTWWRSDPFDRRPAGPQQLANYYTTLLLPEHDPALPIARPQVSRNSGAPDFGRRRNPDAAAPRGRTHSRPRGDHTRIWSPTSLPHPPSSPRSRAPTNGPAEAMPRLRRAAA